MQETDLRLEPNEASDLTPLGHEDARAGWAGDRAFATVLDEAPAEGSIAVIGHQAGASLTRAWYARRIRGKAGSSAGKTQDAEAWRHAHDGWFYALGSQFGSKDGPLDAQPVVDRARAREGAAHRGAQGLQGHARGRPPALRAAQGGQ